MKTSREKTQERRKANEEKRIIASLFRNPPKPEPKAPQKERQEIHCHDCNNYVQFDIDMGLDGQHVLDCPRCGHKHYRVVRNGKITAERWGRDPSQGSPIYSVSNITYSVASASTASSAGYYYDQSGWSTASTGGW